MNDFTFYMIEGIVNDLARIDDFFFADTGLVCSCSWDNLGVEASKVSQCHDRNYVGTYQSDANNMIKHCICLKGYMR